MQVAEVFVNIPVKSIAKAFSYIVPDELTVGVGWRVFVPFGGRKVEGFILSVGEGAEEQAGKSYQLKDIISAVDEEAWCTPEMIKAARWLSDFYLCSLAEIMRLFMPGKSGLKITVSYAAE
jgi:primosomal protein N' (replication factor Y)